MGTMMRFIGTGASEGIPDPFCSCPVCEHAREHGGPEVRTRAAFRVTDEVQIDFGPDSYAQSVFFGNDLRSLKHLLISHAHDDHLAIFELLLPEMVYGELKNRLTVYLTDQNFDMFEKFDQMPLEGKPGFFSEKLKDKVDFVRLEYGREYEIGDIFVTPIRATHACFFGNEGANYLMRLPDGKKVLYSVDTGYYSDATLEALRNVKLDYFVSECTRGSSTLKDRNHMNIEDCNRLFSTMYANGTITGDTKIYVTHISHKHSFTHADLAAYFKDQRTPYSVTVAYDGLIIER